MFRCVWQLKINEHDDDDYDDISYFELNNLESKQDGHRPYTNFNLCLMDSFNNMTYMLYLKNNEPINVEMTLP